MGEVRLLQRCSFTYLKKVFSLTVLGLCAEFCLCTGVFTYYVLNVYLPILAICVCIFQTVKPLHFSLFSVYSSTFVSTGKQPIGIQIRSSPLQIQIKCTQLMQHIVSILWHRVPIECTIAICQLTGSDGVDRRRTNSR